MTSVSVVEGLFGPSGRILTFLSSLLWISTEAARSFNSYLFRTIVGRLVYGLFRLSDHIK